MVVVYQCGNCRRILTDSTHAIPHFETDEEFYFRELPGIAETRYQSEEKCAEVFCFCMNNVGMYVDKAPKDQPHLQKIYLLRKNSLIRYCIGTMDTEKVLELQMQLELLQRKVNDLEEKIVKLNKSGMITAVDLVRTKEVIFTLHPDIDENMLLSVANVTGY